MPRRVQFPEGSSRGKRNHPATDVGSSTSEQKDAEKEAAKHGSGETIYIGIGENPFAGSGFGKTNRKIGLDIDWNGMGFGKTDHAPGLNVEIVFGG